MSNSIINTANSKTVGSPSADANGALPESGDVFANLFQFLNSSAQVQSGEGSDLLNIQNVGINVIELQAISRSHIYLARLMKSLRHIILVNRKPLIQ
jgi:hypothetical protein